MINVTILPDVLEVGEGEGFVPFQIFRTDSFLIDSGLEIAIEATTVPNTAQGITVTKATRAVWNLHSTAFRSRGLLCMQSEIRCRYGSNCTEIQNGLVRLLHSCMGQCMVYGSCRNAMNLGSIEQKFLCSQSDHTVVY